MIPNVIHFVFGLDPSFGGRPFCMAHYLAIRSAYEINDPVAINFHCHYEPDTYWWERAKSYVQLRELKVPESIFDNPLVSYAHKADVIRLRTLLAEGGIYLDIDTICLKPLTPLLTYSCVLGQQVAPDGKNEGLCNAVILAEPQAPFLKEWYESYRSFRGTIHGEPFWDEHSVQIPEILARRSDLRDNIHIEPASSFFKPHWTEISLLFEEKIEYPDAYCYHLWESLSYGKYLCSMQVESLVRETTYNVAARKYFPTVTSLLSSE